MNETGGKERIAADAIGRSIRGDLHSGADARLQTKQPTPRCQPSHTQILYAGRE